MKKNGKTSAGRTRWRRKDPGRGSPLSRGYDRRAADPETSPRRLSSRQSRAEHAIPARTPRRMNESSWGLWPPVPLVGEVYGVAHLDGVRLHRDAVVLMAIACGHVIGRHVAKSETAAAWAHPIAGIAPPLAVAVDGGGGIPKALRERRPDTKARRRLFHVYMNITQPTGIKPRSGAGKQLRKIAVALSRVTDTDAAAAWPASYNQWGQTYDAFLDGKGTYADGTIADRRQRLVRARRMIRERIPREPPVHVPGTDQGSHHADPSDEQPHRVMERADPRHAPPPPGIKPVAPNHGDPPAVPSTHPTARTGLMAHDQRHQ